MSRSYYNKNDFMVELTEAQLQSLSEKRKFRDALGDQVEYDVFLSHSTKDMVLIRKIRDILENNYGIAVYIDWDEDEGTSRDDIADVVKNAMDRSHSFLIVKTYNSDESSWVSWETGYFDNKDADKIGVLLVEDDEEGFNSQTFKHQEYLKNYIILGPEDIVDFVKHGIKYIKKKSANPVPVVPMVEIPKKVVRPHAKG